MFLSCISTAGVSTPADENASEVRKAGVPARCCACLLIDCSWSRVEHFGGSPARRGVSAARNEGVGAGNGGDPRAPERCSRAGHRCPRTEDLRPRAEWGRYHSAEGCPRDGQRRPRQRELRPRSVQRGPRAKWGRRLPGESPVSGRKAAPGGKISRVGRENEFIAGIRCDGRDWSTGPARCASPTSRTPVSDAEIRRTASPGDREPGLTFSQSPCLLHSQSSFLVFHRLHELR